MQTGALVNVGVSSLNQLINSMVVVAAVREEVVVPVDNQLTVSKLPHSVCPLSAGRSTGLSWMLCLLSLSSGCSDSTFSSSACLLVSQLSTLQGTICAGCTVCLALSQHIVKKQEEQTLL